MLVPGYGVVLRVSSICVNNADEALVTVPGAALIEDKDGSVRITNVLKDDARTIRAGYFLSKEGVWAYE